MHFEDLSSYNYEVPLPLPGVRNVGWLSKGIPYPTGNVPSELVESLKQWATKGEANRMRGYELCRFCSHNGYEQMSVFCGSLQLWLGASEIWMPDGSGGIFAAPSLIIHYVEAHNYLPPTEFVEAALRPIPEDWNADDLATRLIQSAFARQSSQNEPALH
jgi:hypothetical protein